MSNGNYDPRNQGWPDHPYADPDDYEVTERCQVCNHVLNADLICEWCTEDLPPLKVAGMAEVERMVRE